MNINMKTIGSYGAILVASTAFLGKMYSDIEVLKHRVDTQTAQLIEVSKQLTEISADNLELLNSIDKRISIIESTK